MINQDLVKQFHHIKAGTLSGVLRLDQNDIVIRFYFEEGSLLLLDFGQDKELVMAGHFIELHKIDDAMCSYAKSQYTDHNIPIVETLLKQQLVHQDEIDQVTRYMVEDILCRVFSNDHSTTWKNVQDVDINSFDIDKTTVKIRIDIDMLLTMVQSRIQEREHVNTRIADWNAIYSIQEDSPPDDQLNEMERNVLSFVDGRQSVKDIARGVRESNVNIGIYICSLETQGFIRKGGVKKSTRTHVQQPTSEPVAPSPVRVEPVVAATAAAPIATARNNPVEDDNQRTAFDESDERSSSNDDFKVYTGSHVRSESKRGSRPIIMAVILIAVVLVAGMVWSDMQAKRLLKEQSDRLDTFVESFEWNEAEKVLAEVAVDAKGSRSGQKNLEHLISKIHQGFSGDFVQIEGFLTAGEWEKARDIIATYPNASESRNLEHLWTVDLGNHVTELKAEVELKELEIEDERTLLASSLKNLLRSGNIKKAVTLIQTKSDDSYSDDVWMSISDKATRHLRAWRIETIRHIEAGMKENTRSYKWLFEQIENVQTAETIDQSNSEIDILHDLTGVLKEHQNQLLQRLSDVPALLDSGDYVVAKELLEKLSDNVKALSTEKGSLVVDYSKRRDDIEAAVTKNRAQLARLLDIQVHADVLKNAIENVRADLKTYSALPNRAENNSLMLTAEIILKSFDGDNLEEELVNLEESLGDTSLHIHLIENRIQWLTHVIKTATVQLTAIKKKSKDGAIDDAMRSLKAFIDEDNYSRTIVYAEAKELHKSLMERQAKNKKIYKQFEAAILEDDVVLVSQLLPQLETKTLPYVVSSVPSGAKIFMNGVDTGHTTPHMYPPLSNAQRADVAYEIRQEGYRIAGLSPFNAEQSWRLRAVLQRKPIVEVNLEQSVNSALAVIDETLWLSSNKSIWSISKDGRTHEHTLGNSSSTIYAPASKIGDNIYVPTRGRSVLRIDSKGVVSNIPVSVSSNHAINHYVSPVIIDMELLIMVDAVDGSLHAIKESDNTVQWRVPGTSRAACSPILVEDRVLCVYRNGTCKAISADNGNVVQNLDIGDPIISAWIDGDSISGYTPTRKFTWSGEEIVFQDLLKNIVFGGPGVIKTKDNRVRVPNAEGRFDIELGRITEDLTAMPVLWNNHAVCPVGNKMIILGAHGFTISSSKPMLAPILMGDILIIASSDGHVRYLKK